MRAVVLVFHLTDEDAEALYDEMIDLIDEDEWAHIAVPIPEFGGTYVKHHVIPVRTEEI